MRIYIIYGFVLFILLACSKKRNVSIEINNEQLDYKSEAFHCSQDDDLICMNLTPRKGQTETSVSVDILYIIPEKEFSPITSNNTQDSVFILVYQGIPELGIEERRFLFEIDFEQSADFQLIEYTGNEGICRLNLFAYYCPDNEDCNFFNADFTNLIEGEFEFKVF